MRFIFIGGCGRSGTTLVQKLIVSHSKVIGASEFDHTSEILKLYQKMSDEFFLNRHTFFYDREVLKQRFREFYKSFFVDMFYKSPDALFFAEKTPSNISVVDLLLEIFDDSLFINVVRDGRDVLLSTLEVKDRYIQQKQPINNREWTIHELCVIWNRCIEKGLDVYGTDRLSQRFLTIQFETLVSNPESEIRKLCSWLNLDFESQLIHPEEITEIETGFASNVDGLWYTSKMYRQNFNPERIGRWKTKLNPYARILGSILMSKNLKALGYYVNPIYLVIGDYLRKISFKLKHLFRIDLNLY